MVHGNICDYFMYPHRLVSGELLEQISRVVNKIALHTEKYYSKNSYVSPEEMPVNKNPVGSTVFHANFIASVADTARIFYLK